jgi:tetratricopeptide (TPR) repeat protein
MEYYLNELDSIKFQRLINAILTDWFGTNIRITPLYGSDGGSDGETAPNNPYFEFQVSEFQDDNSNDNFSISKGRYVFQTKHHRTVDTSLSKARQQVIADFKKELTKNVLPRTEKKRVNHFFLLTNVPSSKAANLSVDNITKELLREYNYLHADIWWKEKIVSLLDQMPAIWISFPEIFAGKKLPENYEQILEKMKAKNKSFLSESNIPLPKNKKFTGREKELLLLANSFLNEKSSSKQPRIQIITGLLGAGKTQLAIEYCYQYGENYRGIHWINAQNKIKKEIADCGAIMDIPVWPETTAEQFLATVKNWNNNKPRLIIFDSLNEPSKLYKKLSLLNGLDILVTTRKPDWPDEDTKNIHKLDCFTEEESISLLKQYAPRLDKFTDTELSKITSLLGNLPQAIDLAGHQFEDIKHLTPRKYFSELKRAIGGLHTNENYRYFFASNPTEHEKKLFSAIELNLKTLDKTNETDAMAIDLFLACGYLAPNTPIDRRIFLEYIGSEKNIDLSLKRLQNIGLLDGNISIHPLFAEFAKTQDKNKLILKKISETLVKLSYEANLLGLPKEFIPYRAHIESILEETNKVYIPSIDDLWGNLGCHLRMVAEYEAAKIANRKALTIDEIIYSEPTERKALRLNNLGRVYETTGNYKKAKKFYAKALNIEQSIENPDPTTIALRYNNLGMIYKNLGDYINAEKYILKALEIDSELFPKHHKNIARDKKNLGWIYKDSCNFQKSLNSFEESLEIDSTLFKNNNSVIAEDYNNIGWVYMNLGKFGTALEYFQKALDIDENHIPNQLNPAVARDKTNIGWVKKDMGELNAALNYFQEAYLLNQEIYEDKNPIVVKDLFNIAIILKDMGKTEKALETLEEVQSELKKIYNQANPDIANVLHCIGTLYMDTNNHPEAIKWCSEALEMDMNVFGKLHTSVARDLTTLGNAYLQKDEKENAILHFQKALFVYENTHPGIDNKITDLKETINTITNN